MMNSHLQWSIFSTVHQAARHVFGVWPDAFGKGGHCPFFATTGCLLTSFLSDEECKPRCGGATIHWKDSYSSGYRPDMVDFSKGRFHSWFVVGDAVVDLRTVLLADCSKWPRKARGSKISVPPFVWGDAPDWLQLAPQDEATAKLTEVVQELSNNHPMTAPLFTAAHLLKHGLISEAGYAIGTRYRQWLDDVERQRTVSK